MYKTIIATHFNRNRLLAYFTVLIILIVIVQTYNQRYHTAPKGDESYYVMELNYLEDVGILKAVQDGTAIGYLLLAKGVQVVLQVTPLQALRILSFLSYLGICVLILSLSRINSVQENKQMYAVGIPLVALVFTAYAKIWLFRGYADLTAAFFFLGVLKLAFQSPDLLLEKRKLLLMGVLAFISCTIRPTSLIMIVALGGCYATWCLLKRQFAWKLALYFITPFLLGMILYLLPSFLKYDHIRMENKELVVVNGNKEKLPERSWSDLNFYAVLYPHVHKKVNKWAITHEEVAQFKAEHPGSLPNSFAQFVKENPLVWLQTTLYKVGVQSYYYVFSGFFMVKWTSVIKYVPLSSKLVQNTSGIFAFVVFLFLWWRVKNSGRVRWLFLWCFVYGSLIAAYSVGQLEENWMIVPNLMISALFIFTLFHKISNFYIQSLIIFLQSAFLILVL